MIGTNCYEGKVAIGILPNDNYVVITPQVDLLFVERQLRGSHYLLMDEHGKLYAMQVEQSLKKRFGYIILLIEIEKDGRKFKAVTNGLRLILSSHNPCDNNVETSTYIRYTWSAFEDQFRER